MSINNNDLHLIMKILIMCNAIIKASAMGWIIEIKNDNKLILRKKKSELHFFEKDIENVINILLF